MRLDAWLTRQLGMTRREAQILIRQKRVSVTGPEQVISTPKHSVQPDCMIWVDGDRVESLPDPIWIMMNKAPGRVCSHQESEGGSVYDMLPRRILARVQTVGRLDKDTTGLLLLTDDGKGIQRLTHPKHKHTKCYRVHYEGNLVNDAVERVHEGLFLPAVEQGAMKRDGFTTAPAELKLFEPGHAMLELHEGKYHQVKRMFAVLGGRVTALHRQQFAGLGLDPSLEPDQWRFLNEEEIRHVL